MDSFKIENFEKDFPAEKIKYKRINGEQTLVIFNNLREKLFLQMEQEEFFKKLENLEYTYTMYINKDVTQFKSSFLEHINNFEKNLFVFNINFDDLDYIDSKDLLNFFDYIWYPSSDDFLIFDSSYSWLIYVTHFGSLNIFLP